MTTSILKINAATTILKISIKQMNILIQLKFHLLPSAIETARKYQFNNFSSHVEPSHYMVGSTGDKYAKNATHK